jgi:hypothetical protein
VIAATTRIVINAKRSSRQDHGLGLPLQYLSKEADYSGQQKANGCNQALPLFYPLAPLLWIQGGPLCGNALAPN